MRTSLGVLGAACLLTSFACTGPDREAFPEDPTGTTSADTVSSTGSSPTSTASTASSSDGGGDPGAGAGGTGPGPGGGEGGDPAGPGNGGGGNDPVGPGGHGGDGGTGGTGGTGAGGDGGGPVCDPVDNVCVPEAPAGWTGPIALYDGPLAGSLPPCNLTPYPTQLGDYFGDLDEGTPACSCDCDPASGIVCSGSATLCYKGSDIQCFQVCSGTQQTVANGACVNTATQASTYVSVSAPTPSNMGSCQPDGVNDIPEPEWGVEARVCTGAATTPVGCEAGELCAPRAGSSLDTLCIVHPGVEACPNPTFSVQRVRHTTFDDGRTCSGCACGSATSTCGGSVAYISSCSDPLPVLYAEISAGQCAEYREFGNPPVVEYAAAPSGSCTPTPGSGELDGEVTVDGTVTLCCME